MLKKQTDGAIGVPCSASRQNNGKIHIGEKYLISVCYCASKGKMELM